MRIRTTYGNEVRKCGADAGCRSQHIDRDIWVVTDGRAGNENQALGLAEAVAELTPATVAVKRIALRAFFATLPPAFWPPAASPPPGWPFSALTDRGAQLRPPWPDLTIGAGRRSAPITAAIRKLGRAAGGRTIAAQILAPQMRADAFDLIAAPAHDRLHGANVISTVGALNRLRPEMLNAEAEALAARALTGPGPKLAVLVGGPSRSARFGAAEMDRMTDALRALAASGVQILATPSGRTGAALTAQLRAGLAGTGAWIWDGSGQNPHLGLLGLADAFVVTEDSVNMASEAASTGKPVFIAPAARRDDKIARFHAALSARGATRPLEGRLESWSYPPLTETARVAARLYGLIFGPDAPPDAPPDAAA